MNIQNVKKELEILLKKEVFENEKMSKHTSFKVGGNADIFVKASALEEIISIKNYVKKNNIPLTIIGNGSNLLVKDNGIRGVVLKIANENYSIKEIDDYIELTVDSGMLNGKLSQILLKKEITGFECFSGIPGTIGGAIKMNAGAYGSEFKDIVKSVKYINENNDVINIMNENLCFKYRESFFTKSSYIITEATLILKKGTYKEIKSKMDELLSLRLSKQPFEFPSAGSTFKRGEGFITAKLIDEAGLRGYTIGGAQVSTKHAGFIVNIGNATAEDIIKLINYVKEIVFNKFNKQLQLEIEVVGE